ncbi:MAG: hypothetical protein L6282_15285 [Candidatus Methanoperedenaceae archaeon]|nr:hypothetical protein [Candidatus Methanoperedenaceae archaeon]
MSFFPSSSYLRKLIRASEERLAFLESEKLLPKNAARKEEILRAKSELETEIVRLKQDLNLAEEAIVAKVPTPATKRIPFNEWSQERLLLGSKTATSRTSQYGKIGDTFQAGDKTFELTDVSRKSLEDIAQNHYLDEGAKSPEEFIRVWNSLHPKGFDPKQVVYFHKFKELTPGIVHPEKPLIKSPLTQTESAAVTASELRALELESELSGYISVLYSRLLRETDAAKAQKLRAEVQYLSETKKLASSSPEQAQKRLDDLRTVKRIQRETQPVPPAVETASAVPDTKESFFFADWMESQEESLRMAFDKKKGTYSAAVSRGEMAGLRESELESLPPILQPREDYARHWHDFSMRRNIVSRFFSRKDRISFSDNDLIDFKLDKNGLPTYIGEDERIIPAKWLWQETDPRTLSEDYSAYYSKQLRPTDVPKDVDIYDPRTPEVYRVAKQPYSPLAMEQQNVREAEELLVRHILLDPMKEQAWRNALTSGEVINIVRRGGIEQIKSDVKAGLINKILYGHVTPASKGPISPQQAVREWRQHASIEDIKFADRLFGSEENLMRESVKQSQISDILALRRSGKAAGIEEAFEEWTRTVPKEDADTLLRRAGGREKLIQEIKSTSYTPERWPITTIEQLRQLPVEVNPLASRFYRSHKVSLKGMAIEEHPSSGTGPIQQKLWFIDTSVGAEAEKKKILITTFKGEGAPEIPLLQEIELKSVFAQPYGPEGKYWNVNIKPALGSRISPVGKGELLEEGKKQGLVPSYPKPSSTLSIVHDMDITKPYKMDPVKGTIIYTTKSGQVIEKKIPRLEKRGIRSSIEGDPLDEFEDEFLMMGIFPLAFTTAMGVGEGDLISMPASPLVQMTQEQKELALKTAMRRNVEEFKAMFAIPSELGQIWYGKLGEAYESLEERQAAYAADPSKRRIFRPLAFFEDIGYLGGAALDVLGGALYPLIYPSQALAGEVSGIGAMEGIRQEADVAGALGIENWAAALATNIVTDPLILLPIGWAKRAEMIRGVKGLPQGIKAMLVDTRAEITPWEKAGMSRGDYVKKVLEEADRGVAVAAWIPRTMQPPSPQPGEIKIDDLWAFFNREVVVVEQPKVFPPGVLSASDRMTPAVSKLYWEEYRRLLNRVLECYKALETIPAEDTAGFERAYKELLKEREQIGSLETTLRISTIEQASSLNKIYSLESSLSPQTAARIADVEMGIQQAARQEYLKRLPHAEPAVTHDLSTLLPELKTPAVPPSPAPGLLTPPSESQRLFWQQFGTPIMLPSPLSPTSPRTPDYWKYVAAGTAGAGLTGVGLYGLTADIDRIEPAEIAEPLPAPPAAQLTLTDTAIEGALGIIDILNIPNYAIGALISGRDFSDKTLISEALGITDKDTSLLSWRGAAGLAADIFFDPTTYLTLGGSAAVKIGAAGGKRIALSGRGVRTLAALKKTHGAEAEGMLATAMLSDPKLYKKFHAIEGIGMRTWGPVIGGKFEYELVSREMLGQMATAPGSINDEILRRMITSGRVPLEKAAVAIKGAEMSAAQKAARIRDVVGEALVPFYRIKKLKRPASLAPGEPEYVDRFLRFKKTVRADVQKYVKIAEDLAKRAKVELGEDYNEILMKHLEVPVLPRTELSKETRDILETIEGYHKMFAIGEKQRDILEREIPGYLRHALTKEAREYLSKGEKASTEIYNLASSAGFAEGRTYKGTIEDINARFRATTGEDFDLFESNVFAAFGIRASEHAKAVEKYDFLEWVAKNYGEDVPAITDPSRYTYADIPQLNARLPPGVDKALLQDAKDIINQFDPAKTYTAKSGMTFTAQDVLNDLESFGFISAKAAPLTKQHERAYAAIYLSRLLEGSAPGEAANYARANLLRTQLPKEIAEHLEPAIFPKETADYLKAYDKALTAWKFGQTVPWPAYHAQNIVGGMFNTMLLGEMRMRSAEEALSMLTGKSKGKEHITALGDRYTTEEILNAAERLGITGQPGAMDIPREIKDVGEYIKHRTSEKTLDKIGVGWSKVSPTTVARTEEDWMRVSIFHDRLMRGDTEEDAAKYVAKFLFEYMPEGKTAFETSYMKRMIPFYTWMRGNVPLQLEMLITQPGKYAAFAKTNQAMMGNLTAQDWTGNWDVTVPAGGGYFYDLRTPASDIDRINSYIYALTGPAQTEEDLYKKLRALEMTAPSVKGPVELATGWNIFAQQPYDSRTEAALSNMLGKPYGVAVRAEEIQGYRGTERFPQKAEDFTVKQVTSVGRYKTQSLKDLEELFKKASRRKEDFTWQQRFEAWQRDMMASPLSGIPYELQGGHMLAVAEGGKAEMSNLMTMTIEENLEQTASQMFRLGLPEKEFKQEEFWEEMDTKYESRLEEKTEETRERLEEQGKWVNAAVRGKLEYDARKAINIQLYSRELAKVRMQRDWAARRLRTEIRNLDRKIKDPDFKGDPWSERQIEALEIYFIPKYEMMYAQIDRLREEERAKEFELPEQIIRGEDYSRAMLGKEREVVIRGKGPALADPEHIKNMVAYEDIAMDRAYILGDVAVVDLSTYLPEHLKGVLKHPTGQPWEGMQEKAKKYDIEIAARKKFLVPEPSYISSSLVAIPDEAQPRLFPQPFGSQTIPVYPEFEEEEEQPRLFPQPFGSQTIPVYPEFEEEPQPRLEAPAMLPSEKTDTEKAQDSQLAQETMRSEFLESDDFYEAVQAIVIETLDRGNER